MFKVRWMESPMQSFLSHEPAIKPSSSWDHTWPPELYLTWHVSRNTRRPLRPESSGWLSLVWVNSQRQSAVYHKLWFLRCKPITSCVGDVADMEKADVIKLSKSTWWQVIGALKREGNAQAACKVSEVCSDSKRHTWRVKKTWSIQNVTIHTQPKSHGKCKVLKSSVMAAGFLLLC